MASQLLRPRYVLAGAFMFIGVAFAFRALTRSLPQTSSPPVSASTAAPRAGNSADEAATRPEWTQWYVPAAEMRFEVTPTETRLDSIVADAASLARKQHDSLPTDHRLEDDRLEALLERFRRHFRIILAGDYDGWIGQVVELGGSPDKTTGVGDEPGFFPRERFVAQASAFRLAPLSLESLRVRPLMIAGEAIDHGPRPGIWGQALYRGEYGTPEDVESARLDVYEVLLPMKMLVDTGTDKPMNVGFSYFWSEERATWVPYKMQFYTDQGGKFVMFVF